MAHSSILRCLSSLSSRGLMAASSLTLPAAAQLMQHAGDGKPPAIYCGFDPTAPSLHVGHLPLLLMMKRLAAEMPVVALIGGFTGGIGDPTGRDSQRILLEEGFVAANSDGITRSIQQIMGDTHVHVVNNREFYEGMGVRSFLRDVCTHVRVSSLLNKDSVSLRLQSGGLSLAEMSYSVLQAHDFWHLHRAHNVRMQIGGADQWGNITTGIDYVRRKAAAERKQDAEAAADVVWGMTVPLITTSTGVKIGKSAGNAVFLDAMLTSHHDFYQYLLKSADADVKKFMLMLTLLEEEEIEAAMLAPPPTAQKLLAETVTSLVRGPMAASAARRSAELLFGGTEAWATASPSPEDIEAAATAGMLQTIKLPGTQVIGESVDKVAHEAGLFASRSDARRALNAGAIYINGQRVSSEARKIDADRLIGRKFILIAHGKKDKRALELA